MLVVVGLSDNMSGWRTSVHYNLVAMNVAYSLMVFHTHLE